MGRMIFSCAIFRVAKIVRGSLEGQMVPEREPTSGSIQSCAVRHLWLSQESVRDFLPQLSCLSVLVDFCSARLLFFCQWLLSFLSVLSDWLVARGRDSASAPPRECPASCTRPLNRAGWSRRTRTKRALALSTLVSICPSSSASLCSWLSTRIASSPTSS